MQEGCVDTPCNSWDMPDGCCQICDDNDPLLGEFWDMLVPWAFEQTCFRFPGRCDVEVQPCPPCGCAPMSCRCGNGRMVDLGPAFCYPILRDADRNPLLEVVIDGVVQPAAEWRLETDGVTLTSCRSDCDGWPQQDRCRPLHTAGTWSIRATIGAEPPAMLLRGLAQFACELVKDCRGQESCLPDGVRSISRRGQTIEMGDLSETIRFDNEGTGIMLLDKALKQWGCDDGDMYAYFNPMLMDNPRVWEWWGIEPATPVGA